MVFAVAMQLWLAQAGCTKDTDCKGERICEAGVCVAPKVEAPMPPPPPPPPTASPPREPVAPSSPAESWPKVVRRDGLVCVQSLGADGRVEESCRKEEPVRRALPAGESTYDPPVTSPRRRRASTEEEPPPEPPARFVIDALAHGGVTILSAGSVTVGVPQLSGTLALGARFRSGIGVMGFGNLQGMFGGGGSFVIGTVAPALRFGDRTHFTLAGGAAFGGVSSRATGTVTGTLFTIHAQGVFAVASAFAVSIQGAFYADASGVLFTFGAGIGFGAF